MPTLTAESSALQSPEAKPSCAPSKSQHSLWKQKRNFLLKLFSYFPSVHSVLLSVWNSSDAIRNQWVPMRQSCSKQLAGLPKPPCKNEMPISVGPTQKQSSRLPLLGPKQRWKEKINLLSPTEDQLSHQQLPVFPLCALRTAHQRHAAHLSPHRAMPETIHSLGNTTWSHLAVQFYLPVAVTVTNRPITSKAVSTMNTAKLQRLFSSLYNVTNFRICLCTSLLTIYNKISGLWGSPQRQSDDLLPLALRFLFLPFLPSPFSWIFSWLCCGIQMNEDCLDSSSRKHNTKIPQSVVNQELNSEQNHPEATFHLRCACS